MVSPGARLAVMALGSHATGARNKASACKPHKTVNIASVRARPVFLAAARAIVAHMSPKHGRANEARGAVKDLRSEIAIMPPECGASGCRQLDDSCCGRGPWDRTSRAVACHPGLRAACG